MNNLKRISIETVGNCNLKCEMCPTLSYCSKPNSVMSDKTFNKIISQIDKNVHVDLTGWGEPLLDKKLFDRIKQLKDKGCSVSFISNGTLLTRDFAKKIVNLNLSHIVFSFDAGTKDIYEQIRIGAKFQKVIDNIKFLVKETKDNKSNMLISITFIIMEKNKDELIKFINLFSKIGIKHFTFKPLDVITNKNNFKQILTKKESQKKYEEVKKIFKEKDISINQWNLYEKPKNNCLADTLNSLFIAFDGSISPCCNLGHPVNQMSKSFLKELFNINSTSKRYTISNINETNLKESFEMLTSFHNLIKKNKIPKQCKNCNLI